MILAGAVATYGIGWKIAYDLHRFRFVQKMDTLELKRKKIMVDQAAYRFVWDDENGRPPMIAGPNGQFIYTNTMRAFTLDTIRQEYPILEQSDALAKLLLAARNTPAAHSVQELVESTQQEPTWPEMVYLDELGCHSYSSHSLILGVVPKGDRGYDLVRGDLADMIHVLIASRSGWGKSKLLQTVAYQLARSRECDLALVDYGVNTFAQMQRCRGLRYSVADTPEKTAALFIELNKEMIARKRLYANYPRAENLEQFNNLSGSSLKPIVCLCDEGTQLVTREGVKEPLTDLLQQARKFGVWVVLAGQNWKASILPTEIRDNFSSRIALHTSPSTSRIMIDSADATSLPVPGRAIALLPGQQAVTMQVPIVRNFDLPDNDDVIDLRPQRIPDDDGDLRMRVIEEWENMDSPNVTLVTKALFNQSGGRNWSRVRDIVDQEGLT